MLFNSYPFIFIFLPLTLVGFLLLRRAGAHTGVLTWLILVSLAFYAWWYPINLIIMGPSILANYAIGRLLLRHSEVRPRLAQVLLTVGMLGNLAFLSYFKYRNFFLEVTNDVFGTHYIFTHLVLPLGISFITFQKIAFLVDIYTGRIRAFDFRSYSLFVLFFPQLIAGPIVHYREMMPQFDRIFERPLANDLAVGAGLFFFGLFKKVILADGIAVHVSPIFASASAGEPVTLCYAWIATVGFTLQVYFDFSGYSEMALGAARCFGISLPMNFNSPLRATSIIDFWRRWHVTLVRFLTTYLFNPLAHTLASRHSARNGALSNDPRTSVSAFLMLLVLPTLVTMLASGVWHGAGYGFILWGLLHGLYLVVNHGWNSYRHRFWPAPRHYDRIMAPVGFVLTFCAVVMAMAFFRAPTIAAGLNVFGGMWGFNGMSVPETLAARMGGWLPAGVALDAKSSKEFVLSLAWMFALLPIAWFLPNVLHLFRASAPALSFNGMSGRRDRQPRQVIGGDAKWDLSRRWAMAAGIAAAIGVLALGQPTEFLYWQF